MVLPATALMDIPTERWARSAGSANTLWGGERGGEVMMGGSGGGSKRWVSWTAERCVCAESCCLWLLCSGRQHVEGSPSLLANRRTASKISFAGLSTYLIISLSFVLPHPPPLPPWSPVTSRKTFSAPRRILLGQKPLILTQDLIRVTSSSLTFSIRCLSQMRLINDY